MESIFLETYTFSDQTEKTGISQKFWENYEFFLIFQNSGKKLKVFKYQKTGFFRKNSGSLISAFFFSQYLSYIWPDLKKTIFLNLFQKLRSFLIFHNSRKKIKVYNYQKTGFFSTKFRVFFKVESVSTQIYSFLTQLKKTVISYCFSNRNIKFFDSPKKPKKFESFYICYKNWLKI